MLKKNHISFGIIAALLVTAVNVFPTPVGAVSGRTYVSNAWGLYDMRYYLDDEFILTQDIDLNDLAGMIDWEPIAMNGSMPFTGSIDGNGHTIRNLNSALIEYANSATFKNIIFENANISVDRGRAGALAVDMDQGLVENCMVINSNISGEYNTGGLIGYAGNIEMINCKALNVNVKSTSESVGGIVGNLENAQVENCSALGNGVVQGEDSVGGLFGTASWSSISRSYATVDVVSTGINGNYGELTGTMDNTTISNPSTLSISGYEEAYEPNLWNDDDEIQWNTNCYAYALNLQRHPNGTQFPLFYWSVYLQPGDLAQYGNLLSSVDDDGNVDPDGMTLTNQCELDALAINGNFTAIGKYETAPSGTYKVALVVDPYVDYHWYRQNPDGTWSHKPGGTEVVNVDNSDNTIYDPQYADRNNESWGLNYSVFLGFFAVEPKDGGMYDTSAAPSERRTIPQPRIEIDEQNLSIPVAEIDYIYKGMSIEEVHQQIGLPQEVVGSGIISDLYLLEDGNKLLIVYGASRDNVKKAALIDPQGNRNFVIE
ncbi:MAG: hypothetical protein LBR74_00520 [Eubacterium sp.]|jgi:hypothetical protein|nr:hypothetical protein [Eubacterium sp.]